MINQRVVIREAFLAVALCLLPSRAVLADSTWTAYNQTNSPLSSDWVASLDFDSTGNLYIGTSGGGLVLIQDSSWTIFRQSNTGVPVNAVRLARRDRSGNLWLGAASGNLDASPYGFGMARLDGFDSTWSMRNQGLEINRIVTGLVIDGQTRYVSTYGGGITIYDDIGWIRYRYSSRTVFTYADSQQQVFNVPGGTYIPTDYIRAIDYIPASHILWLATANGGVVRYDGSAWTTFNSGNSGLPSNQILSVRTNPLDGSVAFGTAGFGAAILNSTGWTVHNTSNSPMINGFISSLEYRPVNGELWIGTGYGVWVLQPDDQWRGYIPPDDNFIWGDFYSDIAFDSIGSVWVSAYGGGIASLFLDSIPQPPPTDSLTIDVERMFIYFYNNKPVERIFTELEVDGAPILVSGDSISFRLDSDLGELYSFNVAFDDFRRHQQSDDDDEGDDEGDDEEDDDGDDDGDDDEGDNDDGDDGDGYSYRYKEGSLMIFLRFDENDSSSVAVSIKDTDAGMNRDNFRNTLIVTLGMGEAVGSCVIFLALGNQWDVPEIEITGGSYSGQFFTLAGGESDIAEFDVRPAANIKLENYPNPFNGRTNISFNLPVDASVAVMVYDMLGRIVDKVYSGPLAAGWHSFAWPQSGSPNSGIYIYSISVDGEMTSKKMTYLK